MFEDSILIDSPKRDLLIVHQQDGDFFGESLEVNLIRNVLNSNVHINLWVLVLKDSSNMLCALDGRHAKMAPLSNHQHQANGIAHDPSLITGHAP